MSSGIKFGVSPAKHRRKDMVFAPNPLSLSVPEPAFESWLRDSGYLEVLDQRTTDLHRLSSTVPKPSNPAAAASATSISPDGVFFVTQLLSRIWTLLSLLTVNPFSKLAADDFSGDTPSWTTAFFGSSESYSFPSYPSQARLRVHENLKRFARNYASLFVIFFACSLYQLPIALIGLISCLALWDVFKFGSDRWGLDRYPAIRQTLIRIAQCVTVIVLFIAKVQFAVFYTFGVSYAVIILHASFRKLTPTKQPAVRGGYRKAARR
ncbi:pra1 family protein h [Phtheirospermum japonicum]|uniref:PRA1 family protein n=1 Tax=Phtheirospermum japonicum TaxID=374723 RepID=A0A830B2S5_9LAMI|nr:pra1 family protein h [Phtheirospermum japonicum]